MTDPMNRIADALDVLALDKLGDYSRDVEHIKVSNRPTWRALNAIRDRIEARHAASALCSFGCGRVATETANGEPACGDGDACLAAKPRKPAQQTPVAAEAGHPASAESALRDRVAPSGGDSGHLSPPPDDDPEWRDVPAEYREWRTVRCGDRHWTGTRWNTSDLDGCPGFPGLYWVKRHDHPARKPAPDTVDVLGSELRVGDHTLGSYRANGDFMPWPMVVSHVSDFNATVRFRVRLPRPAAEPSANGPLAFRSGERVRLSSWADTDGVVVDYLTPSGFVDRHGTPWASSLGTWLRVPTSEPSAKTKCATCRCMIVPGTTCACCESTSGDDPPLPSLDRDEEPSAYCDTKRRDPGCECIHEEGDSDCPVHPSDPDTGEPIGDWHRPSASGEGIARLRHTLLEIGAHSWAVGELHDQPWLMASRIVSAINAAHANATRELRARCERAERERDEARAEFNGAANERDRAKLERIAAIARAEAAERVVEAAVDVVAAWRMPGTPLTAVCVALSNALDAARKDGAK